MHKHTKDIASQANILKALKITFQRLEKKGIKNKFFGPDLRKIETLLINPQYTINEIRNSVIENSPVQTPIKIHIPKSNNKKRIIYKFNLEDRIRAQAIFNIYYPIFESKYHKFLYSYRHNHTHHQAARNLRKHLIRNDNYISQIDIRSYTENIDREILTEMLTTRYPTLDIEILTPFIDIKNKEQSKGIYQGTVLSGAFSNTYLHEIDDLLSKDTNYYARVGDDIIFTTQTNPQQKNKQALDILSKLKLPLNTSKSITTKPGKPVEYLGYTLDKQTVSLSANNLKKAIKTTDERLFTKFPLLNDRVQILKISEMRSNRKTKRFFGKINKHTIAQTRDSKSYLKEYDARLRSFKRD